MLLSRFVRIFTVMQARNFTSTVIPPLKTSDSGRKALVWMQEFQVRHLPIVNNTQFLGLLAEEDILDFNNADEAIGSHPLSLTRSSIGPDEHIFDALKFLAGQKISLLPVVDREGEYLGVITQESILTYFASLSSLSDPGGILVLEVSRRDYLLSEIARIVESCNALVLNSFVTSVPESGFLEVTIKVNVSELASVKAAFERYEYNVKASFQETVYQSNLQDRYDALMSYLNV